MRLSIAAAALVIVAAFVAACGNSSGGAPSGAAGESSTASPAASLPLGPVPGNSVVVPLPTDAPARVRALPALPSCGSEVLFEEDVDITPVPTPPEPTTNPTDNQKAIDCLIVAWESGASAELIVSETSDEADEVFSIYRLPGDGTVRLVVRVLSHADRTISWTQRTCRQLSAQDGTLIPADCDSETLVR
jgi:hypothetical protein